MPTHISTYTPDILRAFLESLDAAGYRANTLVCYRGNLRRYFGYLCTQGKRYDTVDYETLDLWMLYMRDALHLQARTINTALTTVRTFYTWAKRRGYVWDNLPKEQRHMRAPRLLPKPLKERDVSSILDAAKTPLDRAMLETLYSTGCRISELRSLTVGALDLAAGEATAIGKGAERVLYLTPAAVKAIRLYLKWRQGKGHFLGQETALFVGKHNRGPLSPRNIREHIRDCARRAGVEQRVYPHRFRHSCATHLLNHGADLRAVQEILGHASIVTTQIYTGVATDRMRKVFDRCHPRGDGEHGA